MKIIIAAIVVALAGFGAAAVLSDESAATRPTTTETGGHTPITVCHKPGTPAEQELTFDNNALGQIQANAHLGHGDTLGPCPTTTETTTTDPEPEDVLLAAGVSFTEATCDTGPSFTLVKTNLAGIGPRPFYLIDGPLVGGKPVAGQSYTITAIPVEGYYFEGTTVWVHTFAAAPTNCGGTPPPPRCEPPNPDGSYGGQDGKPGNDECVADPVDPPPVTTTTEEPPTTTTVEPPPTTIGEPPVVTEPDVTETVSENPPTIIVEEKPKPTKPRPAKPRGVPKKAPPVCRPGAVETSACGVQGSG